MLKFLRNKIQSLTETQINILTVVLVLINLGIIIFWINFWVNLPKITPPKVEETPPLAEEIPEALKPGEIGEITEEEAEEKEILPLPLVVFNTSGTISEIKTDRLIVEGSGTNFVDQKSRELTIIFTDSTITFDSGQKIQYQGLEGLKYLRERMRISIEGDENIRGKIEFEASIINILQ
ncbi:hypothetical protein KJA16_03300 [Patescibacteria group bacterium]|nr:hypothetical protein [Patescibacteria group bacterium]